ncbi:Phosphate acetyltransferase [Variovorax sp. PBS-H4]|uniref:bifunctional enoyl-CoA hydratase/phosphate acetyltransferase n=1 Tax=Variovorax sp. PBS-H4 TaxID=434008 RepID=UPI00131744C4|nr:bifunctional enoyl-CoA hydratase/phosphate acetyltransferase [Variovorax sp. PBS-H4]VTU41182.1 Phosphate acetyltransferase [Variovorax sp. PBS-H4]
MTELEAASPFASNKNCTFLDGVLATARQRGRRKIAMVFPCDANALETGCRLIEEQIADVSWIGPRDRLLDLGARQGIDLQQSEIIDTGPGAAEAAQAACRLASAGDVDMLMKGSLHTDELMRAVVSRTSGMRTSRRVSHAFVLQVPGRPSPLIISDCVVNVAPALAEKVEILEHAVLLARALGIAQPHVAVLSFTESVLHGAPSTLDAAAIAKMAERGQIRDAVVDGPLAFDNAISMASATSKSIESRVAGKADILLMPNLEAGNAVYKSLVYMAGASCAGVVLGTSRPVILTSRTDSLASKVYSAALGSLLLDAEPHGQ